MDDKKKIVVVGALFVAMLAIGAFEFTKGSGDAPAAPAKDTKVADKAAGADKSKDGDKKKEEKAKNPLLSLPLASRDPFKPISLPNPTKSPSATAQAPKPISGPSGSGSRPRQLRQIPPVQIEGGPLPAALPGTLQGENGGSSLSGPVGVPNPSINTVSSFGYKLKGTLMGDRPMAVFADSQGNERIVPVGSSLDGDSQVVSVQAGAVKLRVHGKTKTMTPGGNE